MEDYKEFTETDQVNYYQHKITTDLFATVDQHLEALLSIKDNPDSSKIDGDFYKSQSRESQKIIESTAKDKIENHILSLIAFTDILSDLNPDNPYGKEILDNEKIKEIKKNNGNKILEIKQNILKSLLHIVVSDDPDFDYKESMKNYIDQKLDLNLYFNNKELKKLNSANKNNFVFFHIPEKFQTAD
ncbi:MAG: hypothetical protein HRT47_00250 [Candidatus Caenarcaniphilales bacterium]|nr:hypothetical protein [Candidatus Caenarcaniphilales bacterium]